MRGFLWLIASVPFAVLGCGETSTDDGEHGGTDAGSGGSSGSATGGSSGSSGSATGGNSGSAGGNAEPVPLADFVSTYVSTLCDNIGPCCARGGYMFDQAACRAETEVYASALAAGALANPPISTYDPVTAGACFALAKANAERCVVEPFPEPNPCEYMFTGTLPEGAPCLSAGECAPVEGSTVSCATQGGATAQCTAMPEDVPPARAALGASCSATCGDSDAAVCDGPADSVTACYTDDGLYCSASSTCAPLPSAGQPCALENYCADDAYCNAGLCVARRTTGPCDSTDECAASAYCNFDTYQCTPKGADGTACTDEGQTALDCLSGGCHSGRCGPPLYASEVGCFTS